MKVRINGDEQQVPDGLTVAALLQHLKVRMPEMVSVQRNGHILKRETFATTVLQEGDVVEFLYFMGGGAIRDAASEARPWN